MENSIIQKGRKKLLNIFNIDSFSKSIFDNLIWVIILIILVFIVFTLVIMKQKFSVSNRLRIINDTYKNYTYNVSLDTKEKGQNNEKFDEIEPSKHTLCDVYIMSSGSSYLTGWKVLDYVSMDMLISNIKYGSRYIEIDINLNKNEDIVIANGIKNGKWILNFNEIEIDRFCKTLSEKIFNKDFFINNKDPLLLFLNIQIPKNRIDELYQYIYQNLKTFLLPKKYNIKGEINVLDLPLEDLYQKIILISNNVIKKTKMEDIVNLNLGDRVKRITYADLELLDEKKSIEFNKNNLTIVEQNYSFKSLNSNPRQAFNKGCQIIAMNFQKGDDFMRQYLSLFYGKSFQLKPFEFTKFIDKPIEGYNSDKIAFYYNQDEYDNKFEDIVNAPSEEKGCCNLILKGEMEQYFPKDKDGIQKSINIMESKLKTMKFEFNQDFKDIKSISINTPSNIGLLKNFISKYYLKYDKEEDIKKIVDTNNSPSESENLDKEDFLYFKHFVIYQYLMNILDKKLEKERIKEFSKKEFQDVCFNKNKKDCNNSKLCYYQKNEGDVKCYKKTSNIPFPKLCIPKHELNRNACTNDDTYNNFTLRNIYHKIHTQPNFSGKWSSAKGIIEIPEIFNDTCEFKFNTEHDNKEFTMFIVNEDGNYVTLKEKQEAKNKTKIIDYTYNDDTIRAKGTFIDPGIRYLEKKYKFPELKYHGLCDIQMVSNQPKYLSLIHI